MKKQKTNFLLLIALVIGLNLTAQSWTKVKPSTGISLNDMYCPDQNTCFVVGLNGIIYKSSDSGATWQLIPTSTKHHLSAITCTDQNNCFVLGEGNLLMRSDNGGQTWGLDSTILPYGGLSIHFYNSSLGFICSPLKGEIYKSTTSGMTWETIKTNQKNRVISQVHFVSQTVGFGITQDYDKATRIPTGYIVKTTDGGINWSIVHTLNNQNVNDIDFASPLIGFAVGTGGTILETSNGGQTWNAQNSGTTANIKTVSAVDINTAYVSGNTGTFLRTINRGATWIDLDATTTTQYTDIQFFDLNTGFSLIGSFVCKTTSGGI